MSEQQSISNPNKNPGLLRRWAQSVGPGLITACVVIGPGSILTSSKIGASEGYSKVWVVLVSVFFMMIYTQLAARLGVASKLSVGDLIRQHVGRPLAVLIGLSVFFIAAAFQFGNNLAVHSALNTMLGFDYGIYLVNAIAIVCMFSFRNLYQLLERVMTWMVGFMLVSFALNLCFAKPSAGEFFSGMIPTLSSESLSVSLLGLVGTTFVIAAAYYQAYLVRFKGWQPEDMRKGMIDARVSAVLMALITLMIMSTAAAVLRGKELASVGDVANQLQPLFGDKGRLVFGLGLFSAAFSSFLVNSMIGGFIFSDGLGLGDRPEQLAPRIFSALVLLVGMFVALFVIKTGVKPVGAIVAAQAVTVLAAPLLAGMLLWLTNQTAVMGNMRNGLWLNVAASLGLLLLVVMSWYVATEKVWPALQEMLQEMS